MEKVQGHKLEEQKAMLREYVFSSSIVALASQLIVSIGISYFYWVYEDTEFAKVLKKFALMIADGTFMLYAFPFWLAIFLIGFYTRERNKQAFLEAIKNTDKEDLFYTILANVVMVSLFQFFIALMFSQKMTVIVIFSFISLVVLFGFIKAAFSRA